MHLAASSSKCLREGRLAQLVEHLVYTERVSGSSPLPPTIQNLKSIRGIDFRFLNAPAEARKRLITPFRF